MVSDVASGGTVQMIIKIPCLSIFILQAVCIIALALAPSIMANLRLVSL
jgi:hypothetical protein